MVDHHDSYTWNLVHLVASVTGVLPTVVQHDEVEPDEVLRHSHVVLSPGPGTPVAHADFAVGREVLLAGSRPVLGVCLGMQGLVTTYGGTVDRVAPAHGVVERIRHDGDGVFEGLPQLFAAVRYHSLAALSLPDELVVTASDAGGDVVMGVRHAGAAAGGRAVPPGVDPVRARGGDGRELPGFGMSVVDAFREAAAAHQRCFWLDGGGAREWSGHRSLIGILEPDDVSLTYSATTREVTRHVDGESEVIGTDVFAVLEDELATGSHRDQWFGYFGYACRPDLPALVRADDLPDAVWMRPSHVRLFDHGPVQVYPGTRVNLTMSAEASPHIVRDTRMPGYSDSPPAAYAEAFARVQEQLHAGNSYEVNLTHRLDAESDLDPVAAYLRLRALNPAPYAGFLQHDVDGARGWLLSSSPERYALITRDDEGDRTIETKPIKGTTPRGDTPEEDEELRRALATEPRFRAENLMITDLLRNDLAMVCEVGSVEVPALLAVESYPTVHQLVSTVRGRLRDDVTTVGALRALFPAGSMTGAPKLRTMEVITDVEDTARGAYAGAFGWLAADGRADLGVVIRTLTTTGNGSYRLGTGGGITVHSDVESEYAESRWKAERLLRAVSASPPPS